MIELKLPDMTCDHCVRTVTQTVHRVDPKAELKIDLAQHRVQVESTHPREQFTLALAEEGYPAQ